MNWRRKGEGGSLQNMWTFFSYSSASIVIDRISVQSLINDGNWMINVKEKFLSDVIGKCSIRRRGRVGLP